MQERWAMLYGMLEKAFHSSPLRAKRHRLRFPPLTSVDLPDIWIPSKDTSIAKTCSPHLKSFKVGFHEGLWDSLPLGLEILPLDSRRNCLDGEITRIVLLLKDLEMVSTNEHAERSIVWNGQQDEIFTVKTCYKTLNGGGISLLIGHGNNFGGLKPLI
ncbi:hypothetical protein HAX54_001331 [Datura stramonium]|uniref:Uncharacterized protein n=1 Tax=Datura stramonium TaxID=4076 RepID=A0ABS8RSQ8_DATST|nr:hypothetical protein [Datura stramonium]